MIRVLVTGANGILGRELVPALLREGYAVRATSRRQKSDSGEGAEWIAADLRTGSGLAEAVEGVDVIIHAATSPTRQTESVDVRGTEALLRQAEKSGAAHFVYPSIIGIESVPFPYYRHKLAAERAVSASSIPYSIQRSSKFHPFIDMLLTAANRLPVMLLPTDFRDQPVDSGEVASRLVQRVAAGPGGLLPDFAGPEILTLGEMAEGWIRSRNLRKRVLHLPIPGRTARRFREGGTTNPEADIGTIRWKQWLEKNS